MDDEMKAIQQSYDNLQANFEIYQAELTKAMTAEN